MKVADEYIQQAAEGDADPGRKFRSQARHIAALVKEHDLPGLESEEMINYILKQDSQNLVPAYILKIIDDVSTAFYKIQGGTDE